MPVERIVAPTRTYSLINPAATQLFTIATTKTGPTAKAQVPKRARILT